MSYRWPSPEERVRRKEMIVTLWNKDETIGVMAIAERLQCKVDLVYRELDKAMRDGRTTRMYAKRVPR